jgi:hypothetical protein
MQGMLISRDCVEALGRFDEHLFRVQDLDFLLHLGRRYKGGFVPEPTVLLGEGHGAMRGPSVARRGEKDRVAYFQRYDRIIFEKVYRQARLEAYIIGEDRVEDEASAQIMALLKRVCVMAKCGIFEKAIQHIGQVFESWEFPDLPPGSHVYLAQVTDVHLLGDRNDKGFIRSACAMIPRSWVIDSFNLNGQWREQVPKRQLETFSGSGSIDGLVRREASGVIVAPLLRLPSKGPGPRFAICAEESAYRRCIFPRWPKCEMGFRSWGCRTSLHVLIFAGGPIAGWRGDCRRTSV